MHTEHSSPGRGSRPRGALFCWRECCCSWFCRSPRDDRGQPNRDYDQVGGSPQAGLAVDVDRLLASALLGSDPSAETVCPCLRQLGCN